MLVKSQWKTISKYLLHSEWGFVTPVPLFRLHGDRGVRQVSYLIVSAFSFQIGFSSAKFTVAKYILKRDHKMENNPQVPLTLGGDL